MQFEYHLAGRGHSGRVVRVEPLGPEEADNMLTCAAKLAGEKATPIEIKKLEWKMGVKQFVRKFSDPCEPGDEPKWCAVKQAQLDEDMGKYFTAKDCQVLESLYREYHEVTQVELDAIVGKMRTVSED